MKKIDELLENIKKISKSEVAEDLTNEVEKNDTVILNNPENLENLDKTRIKDDLLANSMLQEKILRFFEKELEKKFGNFFFTKEGQDIIEKILRQYLEKNNKLIEEILKSEIANKINSAIL